ncbi:DUF1028 domain-containing protein [Mesorhizobium sp. SB112]|uniref:DUF1028 domain-containing protein n=1 Tax=Mesorhizobium sp. SB112 TaxID=3151853 RepID=UPI0032662B6B
MTLSIIALCEKTGHFGIAAATAVPAVGKLLTHAAPRIGAVATQGLLNPYLGIDGIRLLEDGRSAEEVVKELSEADELAERRQFAVIDAQGQTAVWTGDGCKDWAGSISGNGFSVQGNRLTGRDVVDKSAKRFEDLQDMPLIEGLIEALAVGITDGGDRLGERSATIYIVAEEEYPLWDIRVDDHDNPIAELRRLQKVFAKDLLPHIKQMPSRDHPRGEPGDYDV